MTNNFEFNEWQRPHTPVPAALMEEFKFDQRQPKMTWKLFLSQVFCRHRDVTYFGFGRSVCNRCKKTWPKRLM